MMRTTVTIIGGTPGKTAPAAAMGTNPANDTATPKELQQEQRDDWKWRQDHWDRD